MNLRLDRENKAKRASSRPEARAESACVMLYRVGMFPIKFRTLAFATILATSSVFGTGCVAEVEPPAYAEGWQPQYYNGYVVYYDDVGRPFYYVNGGAVWIPRESPFYVGYVNHWRVYGPHYRAWYSHYGYRYRGYRGRR
jgi:hypothetical protein